MPVAPIDPAILYPNTKFGLRPDGTPKGRGFFGELPLKKGGVATEYSMSTDEVQVNGKPVDFPTIVPTLNKAELNQLLTDIIPNNKRIPDAIANKAIDHALKRIADGKSPFAGPDEVGAPPKE